MSDEDWVLAETKAMPQSVQKGYLGPFEHLHPDLLDDAKSAIAAYNRIVGEKNCSAELLDPLRIAALSNRRHLWDLASQLIGKLALRFDGARELILELLSEKSWNTRFTALCCLEKKTPRFLMLKIVEATIEDRSGEVRWKAAQQAEYFGLKEVIPQIEAALSKERITKVRDSLQFSLGLLRDGYLADVNDEGDLHLTVRYSMALSGGKFPKGEWEDREFSALADEVRGNLEENYSRISKNATETEGTIVC